MARSLLDAMPDLIPVSELERSTCPFNRQEPLAVATAFARAAAWIAGQSKESPAAVLNGALAVDRFEKWIRPASPLMPRPGRIAAVNAQAWIALCILSVEGTPQERQDAKQHARELLSQFEPDIDEGLRALLKDATCV